MPVSTECTGCYQPLMCGQSLAVISLEFSQHTFQSQWHELRLFCLQALSQRSMTQKRQTMHLSLNNFHISTPLSREREKAAHWFSQWSREKEECRPIRLEGKYQVFRVRLLLKPGRDINQQQHCFSITWAPLLTFLHISIFFASH